MKATELQIGDLVYAYENLHEQPHKVVLRVGSLSSGLTLQDTNGMYADYDGIDPIPLTTKILEKNGFKKIDFSHYQINDRTLVLDADGKWDGELSWHWVVTEMIINSKGQNVVLNYYVATLNYVHELQHALRLCGLNELADSIII